jgi:hypothetical protein
VLLLYNLNFSPSVTFLCCVHNKEFQKCIDKPHHNHLSVCPQTTISELLNKFPLNLILRSSTVYTFQFGLQSDKIITFPYTPTCVSANTLSITPYIFIRIKIIRRKVLEINNMHTLQQTYMQVFHSTAADIPHSSGIWCLITR